VIPVRFDGCGPFSEGIAWGYVKDQVRYFDRSGAYVTPVLFDSGSGFAEGVAWAREIVAADPSDAALWARAADACADAPHTKIDGFIEKERRRARLKLLECLPHAQARTVELFDTVVSVVIFDKAQLDEDDILPAAILIFGKSREPLFHRVGSRVFVSPGPAAHPAGGAALLAEEDGEVIVTFYGPDGKLVRRESAAQLGANVRMTVQGAR